MAVKRTIREVLDIAFAPGTTSCVPDRGRRCLRGPCPSRLCAVDPAALPCLADDPVAARLMAASASFDPGPAVLSVRGPSGSAPACERLRPPGTADSRAARARYLAVRAGLTQAPFGVPAPDSVGAPQGHAAGIGSSGCAAPAAAPLRGDSDPPNTVVDTQAAGQARERNGDSTGPSRCDAAPNHCPSARPSAAAHRSATRESTEAEPGSSAQGFAGRTPARTIGSTKPHGPLYQELAYQLSAS